MKTITLTVSHAEGCYPIDIGVDLLQDASLFRPHIVGQQVCIVTNTIVAEHYLSTLTEVLSDYTLDVCVLPDGESYKTLATFEKIINHLVAHQHHRDTTVIALGGGVVGDMAGFAAACYQRGVNVIQVPTTLLSQVDSSIGGKTAVNHPKAKNFIGAFYHPSLVVIDLKTLSTLPDREFRAGFAEVLKAALIKDAVFLDWIESHLDAIFKRDLVTLAEMVERACRIKRDVVEKDAKEENERALLNFGHTFGHAIEQDLGYGQWLHGEAVALGMLMATDLSERLGLLSQADVVRLREILDSVGFFGRLPEGVDRERLLSTMYSDKKVYNNQLRLILLSALGHAVISSEASSAQILDVISSY